MSVLPLGLDEIRGFFAGGQGGRRGLLAGWRDSVPLGVQGAMPPRKKCMFLKHGSKKLSIGNPFTSFIIYHEKCFKLYKKKGEIHTEMRQLITDSTPIPTTEIRGFFAGGQGGLQRPPCRVEGQRPPGGSGGKAPEKKMHVFRS